MELVYLWVEKYKNIENQGFNFSPSFTCKYDEASKKLTIDKKEHVSIFPDNINITAIVGENGSGKSRIFEIITKFRFEKLQNKKLFILIFLEANNLNVILSTKKDYHSFQNFNTDMIINNSNLKINSNPKEFWLSFFSNGLSDFTDNNRLLNSNHYDCFYNGCNNDKKFEQNFSSLLKIKQDFFKLLNKDYIFDMTRMEFNIKSFNFNFYDDEIKKTTQKLISILQSEIDSSVHEIGKEQNQITKEGYISNFLISFFLQQYIDTVEDLSNRFPADKKSKFRKEFIENLIINLLKLKAEDKSNLILLQILNEKYKEFKTIIFEINKNNAGELDQFERRTKELNLIENFQDYTKLLTDKFELDTNQNILVASPDKIVNQDIKTYLAFFNQNDLFKWMYEYNYFYINFFNSNSRITFIDLSTGEKQLLNFIVNFLLTLINTKKENRILLLDEIETSLHPQWQKEIFSLILKYIGYLKKNKILNEEKYHIILTSHSPFILSDLPKENVIFLEKDKETGNCKNVSKDIKINSFGANIHTLLAHGFFMQDGLMGEFAKEKINQVYKFLTQNDASDVQTKEQAQQIIDIIGEPLIQKQLQNLFYEKFKLNASKDEEIDYLKKRLQELEAKND